MKFPQSYQTARSRFPLLTQTAAEDKYQKKRKIPNFWQVNVARWTAGEAKGQESAVSPFRLIDHRILFLCLLLVAGCEILMGWLVARINVPTLFIIGLARLAEIFLVFLVLLLSGKGLLSIGLDRKHIARGAMRGVVWSFLFALAAGAVFIVMILFDENPLDFLRTPLPSTAPQIVFFFIVGGLIAPAAEEIVFRGLVYGYLRRWGVAAALVGTTLLFATAHMASGIPLTQIVGGLVFALAYEKEKNLMVPFVIHVLGNLAIFSLSLI